MKQGKTIVTMLLGLSVIGLGLLVDSHVDAAETKAAKPGIQALERPPAGPGGVAPRLLPDLIVERCWQAKGCRFICRFKNIGSGAIPDDRHARSEAHISAGSENPPIKNPIRLKRIDPAGKLKSPGGSVDYDTGCVATAAATGLVWIDTNHQIHEANETNNGANPRLIRCTK